MKSMPVGRKRAGIWNYLAAGQGLLLIFLAALYFYFLAGKMDETTPPGQLGPGFWPKATLILLLFSCGIKALEIYFPRGKKPERPEGEPLPAVNHTKLLTMIALLLATVAAMEAIGFLLANLLFLILFLRVAGVRKKSRLFLTSGLGTLFLLYLFVKVVYLPLPKGYWFFHDLTIFLYRILHLI